MKWIQSCIICLTVSLLVGCTKTPPNTTPMSPIGQTATVGRKVIAVSNGVLTAVDGLATAKTITPADATRLANVIKQIGDQGGRLADGLRVLDAATSPQARVAAADNVRTVLALMQTLVASSVIPIQNENGRAAVQQLMQRISDVIFEVMSVLPAKPIPVASLQFTTVVWVG